MATASALTWQQLRDLRLLELTDAADGWGAVSKFADHARQRVDGDMSGKLYKTQHSESARVAGKRLKRLSENYHYIHTETGLIRGALNASATELGAPQRRFNPEEEKESADNIARIVAGIPEEITMDRPR